jgi:hypothetical protein
MPKRSLSAPPAGAGLLQGEPGVAPGGVRRRLDRFPLPRLRRRLYCLARQPTGSIRRTALLYSSFDMRPVSESRAWVAAGLPGSLNAARA